MGRNREAAGTSGGGGREVGTGWKSEALVVVEADEIQEGKVKMLGIIQQHFHMLIPIGDGKKIEVYSPARN